MDYLVGVVVVLIATQLVAFYIIWRLLDAIETLEKGAHGHVRPVYEDSNRPYPPTVYGQSNPEGEEINAS